MGAHAGSEKAGRGRAGRHRRTGQALIDRRDHLEDKPARRFSLPSPAPSALIGVAVLVLIGAGVIHLSSAGSAVPLEGEAVVAVEGDSPEDSGDTADSTAHSSDAGEVSTGDDGSDVPAPDGEAGSSTGDQDAEAETSSAAGEEGADGSTEVIVHVSGAVQSPGVVRLPAGSRVDDALRAAGGVSDEADLAAVNLARPVADGEQIHVPVPGEEPLPEAEGSGSGAGPGAGSSAGPEGSAPEPGTASGSIDLNTADSTALEMLPGVGPAIAQRIVEHREKNGPFESVDGLLEVSGIGPATLEKIREMATV